jgi:hypothetical protein
MTASQRQNTSLAWALLALALLALGLIAGWPLWQWHAERTAQIERLEQRLFQYQRLAARRSNLQDRQQALRSAEQQSPWFSLRDDATRSASQLQRDFRAAIDSSGSKLISMQPLDEKTLEHDIHRVALTARWQGELPAVQQSLHAIQSSQPVLLIDSLTLSAATKRQADAPLAVQAVISGFFREQAAP